MGVKRKKPRKISPMKPIRTSSVCFSSMRSFQVRRSPMEIWPSGWKWAPLRFSRPWNGWNYRGWSAMNPTGILYRKHQPERDYGNLWVSGAYWGLFASQNHLLHHPKGDENLEKSPGQPSGCGEGYLSQGPAFKGYGISFDIGKIIREPTLETSQIKQNTERFFHQSKFFKICPDTRSGMDGFSSFRFEIQIYGKSHHQTNQNYITLIGVMLRVTAAIPAW